MPEAIHETVIIELYSLLSLLRCGAKNGASLLSKLALSVGSTTEAEVR